MKYKIHTIKQNILSDTHTPVAIYLKLRDKFPNSVLLESSDYHGSHNSISYICCSVLAKFELSNQTILEDYPNNTRIETAVNNEVDVISQLQLFISAFESMNINIANSLFGYTSYNAVSYFEDVKLNSAKLSAHEIPQMSYSFYKYVIEINHFTDTMTLYENLLEGEISQIESFKMLINIKPIPSYKFMVNGSLESTLTDKQYLELVERGKEECKKGNVFQIVLSREYSQSFIGDDFNVYRALRSINPSPYLFYFDFGNIKIMGSSPEAQVVVLNKIAEIHPIAGTFKRTGDDISDTKIAENLQRNNKEMAEHVMLVDLARNDLSKSCKNVNVTVFAETQFYSHVIHLVSKVVGELKYKSNALKLFSATFPAGTLTGAPKVKAMQIIDNCEPDVRDYYGGAIGIIGFDGTINKAIIIRSFLSKDNKLYHRAGAGVTIESNSESELNEVNNKLAALKSAIILAEQI